MHYTVNTNSKKKSSFLPLLDVRSFFKRNHQTPFTGSQPCVNYHAGKNLGLTSLFTTQGGALSLKLDLGCLSQGLFKAQRRKTISNAWLNLSSKYLFPSLFLGITLISGEAWAHTGDLLTEEITGIENLITGGYLRIGLLGACGVAAVGGAIKQNGWMFVSGVMGGVFAYFMKGWILKSFTMII
jgi:hypothetical protein